MTIYALALGANTERETWLQFAMHQLEQMGSCQWSAVYEIPCRQGKGADYYNLAALLDSDIDLPSLKDQLKQLEQQAGRVRPSNAITLDIDLIAYGESLQDLTLIAKHWPLPLDVSLPLSELWPACPCTSSSNSIMQNPQCTVLQKMPYRKIKNILK